MKWIVAACAAAAAIVIGYMVWAGRPTMRATVLVVGADKKPLGKGRLELFAFDDSGAAASPSRKLGELKITGTEPLHVMSDLVPDQAVARITADGCGAGYVFLKIGDTNETAELGPPIAVQGLVRDAAGQAVASAQVLAFGGGASGVVLGEATSGPDGKFEIGGVSATVAVLMFRALKDGYAIRDVEHSVASEKQLVCTLEPTDLVAGQVIVPKGVVAKGLVIQAFQVPGVATTTDAEGRFLLDHLPRRIETRLLVTSLPPGYTHRATTGRAGQLGVVIAVTKACSAVGSIVDAKTDEVVTFATVTHDHGPRGRETFNLDPLGRWKLVNIPEGETELLAFINISDRSAKAGGKVTVTLKDGETKEDVVIRLER